MNFLHKFLTAVLTYIILQVGRVNAIECYICNSQLDKSCEEPAVNHLRNCSQLKEGPKYTGCRKIDNWVDFKVLGQATSKRVIRQCAVDTDKERECYYRAGFGGRANVCDCFHNRCNSATTTIISALTMATTLLVVVLKNFS